ncbi:MAG: hypothetical protein IPK82_31180 [Polyangiaceae bacterium]|nr:hypothetical protein [Polyangiaceae bacterium]
MSDGEGSERESTQDGETNSSRGGKEDSRGRDEKNGGAGGREAALRRKIALGLYVLVTTACFLTAAPERLRVHTPANHFALLAEAWLNGRLDLGGPPPVYTGNNDFAYYDDKHFVSFPPFPAVILLPFVKLAGGAEKLKDGQVFLWFAGIGPVFLFFALERLRACGRSARSMIENAALAAVFALGTVYWFVAVQGTVWFAAHVIGVLLACVYIFAAIEAHRPVLAGAALVLGFATRTPLALMGFLFLFEAWEASRSEGDERWKWLGKRVALFGVPIVLGLALVAWHNRARFGDAFEMGHRYLTVVWRGRIEKWGLFSYHYLGRNLAVMLTSLPYTKTAAAPFQVNGHGLALWVTTPVYAWALWPKQTGRFFWSVAATAGAIALLDLMYQNSGWVQFGYRFSCDFAPLVFVLIAMGGRSFKAPFWVLAAWGILVNGFGALTFDRAGSNRFYFVDPSQRILHQPD